MFRKLFKTLKWYKRFRKSLRKYPVFRQKVWPKFWSIVDNEKLYGIIGGIGLTTAAVVILIACLIDQIHRHALVAPWLILGLIVFALWVLAGYFIRLYEPLERASKYAVEQTRKARGDYVVPSDDDEDDEEVARERRMRHARRDRQHG